ncbi:MAG TPA: signal peptidase I [Mycobacterium sp.]|nr:signal peptidase I [Mycobacterium sp.]
MTDKTESTDTPPGDPSTTSSLQNEAAAADVESGAGTADGKPGRKKKSVLSALIEALILIVVAVLLYFVILTFVARPYLIPSESMEPTLHGCTGCTGDRVMVDKLVYRFGSPEPGDVIVFRGPPAWNVGYKSIRSDNTVVRWLQNTLSFIGFVPPDENVLVKRVIAVGGQTVECRAASGLTVDGKPLDQPFLNTRTMGVENLDPAAYRCLGPEFGPVTVPDGRLWVMGDNRTHSADSRAHCTSVPADLQRGVLCTGDPVSGTIPVENVIGKARFIAWPPSRWGGVSSVDIQQGQ